MPDKSYTCPDCGTMNRMSSPNSASRRVRCRECGAAFAPGEEAAPTKSNRKPSSAIRPESADSEGYLDDRHPSRGKRRPNSETQGGTLVLGLVLGGLAFVLVGGGIAAFVLMRPGMGTEAPSPEVVVAPPANPAPDEKPPAPRANLTPARDPASPSPAGIPLKSLKDLKAATVFIKVEAGGLSGSGSGFVIRTDGETSFIVTNNHVINPKVEVVVDVPIGGRTRPGRSPRFRPPGTVSRTITVPLPDAVLTAVFSSGTRAEKSARAEVVAIDSEHDLAVLKVTGVAGLPRPIDISRAPELIETMPVVVLGFPFGKVLSTGKAGPAITIGKASISSIRRDDHDDVAYVQIDGALNPGNSGGPVVDSEGRLVGIAVATIKGSSGIGLAIPADQLTKMLRGRVGPAVVRTRKVYGSTAELSVEVPLIDPMSRVRSVALHYVRGEGTGQKPARLPEGGWSEMKGLIRLGLTSEKRQAVGTLHIPYAGAADPSYTFQTSYVTDDGKSHFMEPGTFRANAPPPVVSPPPAGPVVQPQPVGAGVTGLVGGGSGGEIYRDAAPAGGRLVGLEIGVWKLGDLEAVRSVRAIFRGGEKETVGPQRGTDLSRVTRLVAKPGYAVGAMNVRRASANADGVSLIFMRIKGAALDSADSYQSEWVGERRPGIVTLLTGGGQPVFGVAVKANAKDVTGLGLVLKFEETAILGGAFDPVFRDEGAEGGVVVGFDVGLMKFFDTDIVRAVRPIYRGTKAEEAGRQRGGPGVYRTVRVKAKDGYAVGAITAKSGLGVDGFSVTFMKVGKDRLDPKEAYESEWVGGKGGGLTTRLGGDGAPVVGVIGKQSSRGELTGLGLLLKSLPGPIPSSAAALKEPDSSP